MRSFKKVGTFVVALTALAMTTVAVSRPIEALDEQKPASDPSEARDTVKIITIIPDPAKPLYVGDTVNLEVTADYQLAELLGTLGLNIQKAESGSNVLGAIIDSKSNPAGGPRL